MNQTVNPNSVLARMKPFNLLMENPANVLEMNLNTSGYILLESGLREFAEVCGLAMDAEPPFDVKADRRFLIARSGDIEFIQIEEDTEIDEEPQTEQPA